MSLPALLDGETCFTEAVYFYVRSVFWPALEHYFVVGPDLSMMAVI